MPANRAKNIFASRLVLGGAVALGIVALVCIPQCRFAFAIAKADIEHSLGFNKQAIGDYQSAVVIDPNSEEALSRLIALLLDNRDSDGAQPFLHILEDIQTPSAQLTVAEHMTAISLNKKDFENALKFSEKWVALAPNSARAYHAKGDALAGLNRSDQAVEALDKSLQIDPGSGAAADRDAVMQKSRVFDSYAESVAHPKLENNSGDYDALIRDSVRLNMADRNEQSEEAASKAIKVRPDGASAYFLRGLSRLLEHHYPTALEDMRTAEKLAKGKSISFPILNYGQVMPSHYEVSDIVFFEGCIELTEKDYKGARADLDRAISMRQVGDYYKARGNLNRAVGRIKDAEHDEAVAAKITPKPGSRNVVIKEPLETILAP